MMCVGYSFYLSVGFNHVMGMTLRMRQVGRAVTCIPAVCWGWMFCTPPSCVVLINVRRCNLTRYHTNWTHLG